MMPEDWGFDSECPGRSWTGPSDPGTRDLERYLAGLDSNVLTALLRRSGNGDREAFARFYSLTSPALAALIAARRLPPPETDAVLVQTYVSIWRRSDTFAVSGCSVWQWTLMILIDALPRPEAPSRPRPHRAARATAADRPVDTPRHLTLVEKIGGSRPRQIRRRAG